MLFFCELVWFVRIFVVCLVDIVLEFNVLFELILELEVVVQPDELPDKTLPLDKKELLDPNPELEEVLRPDIFLEELLLRDILGC